MSEFTIHRTASDTERRSTAEAMALARAVAKHFELDLDKLLGKLKGTGEKVDGKAKLILNASW